MSQYYGDVQLGDTIQWLFTTVDASGVPTILTGSPTATAYTDGGTTQSATGVTLTANFDGVTGLNLMSVVASSGNGFAAGENIEIVLDAGTVDSNTVVGYAVGSFSVENRSNLRPTTVGNNEVDVTAAGEVGLDLDNTVGTLDAAQFGADFLTSAKIANDAFLAVNFAANSLDGKGDWNIGKTGYSLTQVFPTNFADLSIVITTGLVDITQAAADKAWSTATRQLTALQANIIAATSFASGAINAAALATDAVDEIADGVWNELMAGHVAADSAGLVMNDWQDGGRLDLILDTLALEATVAALNNISSANVLTQVNAALDTAIAELGVTQPATTPTLRTGLMLLYMALRNKTDVQTSGADALEIHNDAGTEITSKLLTDDGNDYSEAKMT